MNNKIEEVKRILTQYTLDARQKEFNVRAEDAARQICRLFPKTEDNPDGQVLSKYDLSVSSLTVPSGPKPSESSLLTEEECMVELTELEDRARGGEDIRWDKVSEVIKKAQARKTLSAVREWILAHKKGWYIDEEDNITEISTVSDIDVLYHSLLRGEMPDGDKE